MTPLDHTEAHRKLMDARRAPLAAARVICRLLPDGWKVMTHEGQPSAPHRWQAAFPNSVTPRSLFAILSAAFCDTESYVVEGHTDLYRALALLIQADPDLPRQAREWFEDHVSRAERLAAEEGGAA